MSSVLRNAEPRWERRKDERPVELVAAALTLFVERGFAATKLEDVARRAGVSKGTVYLYFDSKEELFQTVIEAGVLPPLRKAEDLAAGYTGSVTELLRRILLEWFRVMRETPAGAIQKLIISEAGNFPELARYYLENVVSRARGLLSRIMQRGIDSGEFRDCDVEYTLRVATAPILMGAIWDHSLGRFEDQRLDPTRYRDCCMDLIMNGILIQRAR